MRVRLDDLGNGVRLFQCPDFFSFSTDSILLANFVSLHAKDRVADLGTGTGVIPLLLIQRKPVAEVVGVELQPQLVELFRRTIKLNRLEQLVRVVQGDIRAVKEIMKPEQFDVVTSNPPYLPVTGAKINIRTPHALARHEISCTLEHVVQAFSWLVRFGGKVALVHRPGRLVDILTLFRQHHIEPKRLQMVCHRAGMAPNFVLVEGEKGARPGLNVLPPLFLQGGE